MIEVSNIVKRYGDKYAVNDISFTVNRGEIVGFLGPNGAGKSTFMRMLSGVLKPDSGEILVDGEAVYDVPDVKKKIFYISDSQYFFKSGTPKDMMKLYQSYYPDFDVVKFANLLHADIKIVPHCGQNLTTFNISHDFYMFDI